MPLRLAYVGLGNMGAQMAAHLAVLAQADGHALTVWNRSKDKYPALQAALPGAVFAQDLAEAAAADIVFVSLLNDAADTDVVTTLLQTAKGATIVDQSSVNPTTSIALEKAAKAAGCSYLSAPVFGRPDQAKAATLIQVLAGDLDAQARVKPVTKAWSRATLDMGHEAYKGSTIKLMGNALILGVIELLAETYALGDAVGIEPERFQTFIDSFFPTPSYKAYGTKVSTGNFDGAGGFRIEGGLKDARNILACGECLGHPVNLPTIEIAKKNLERAQELGGSDLDWSALAATLRENAGLEPFKAKQNK